MNPGHGHFYLRIRHARLFAWLALFRLPTRWLVETGEHPHHPDCTPTEAVLEQ